MQREEMGDLAAFLRVAEERSFTRAAARLGTSQSAISQTVRRLERRLGLRLLTRTTRSVVPTAAGEQLLETLRPAFHDVRTRIAALTELRDTPAGTLRLTAGRHAAETVLWPALVRLSMRHPEIDAEVVIDPHLTDIVREGFDAGVRLGEQIARDMIAVRIGPDLRMAVVGAPGYLDEAGVPDEPHDLTAHRCINIRLPSAGGLYAWEFEREGRPLNVRVDGPLTLNDMHLAVDAALAGAGLAMVMEDQVGAALADGRLVRVLDEWCPPFPGYHLYYPDRRHPSSAFAALLSELRSTATRTR